LDGAGERCRFNRSPETAPILWSDAEGGNAVIKLNGVLIPLQTADHADDTQRGYSAEGVTISVRMLGEVADYELSAAPAVVVGLAWYPGAHFTDGLGASVGLTARWSRGFAIESVPDQGGGPGRDTTRRIAEVGLRWQHGFGPVAPIIALAYGAHEYRVEPTPAGPRGAERDDVPDDLVGASHEAVKDAEVAVAEAADVDPETVVLDVPAEPSMPETSTRVVVSGEVRRLEEQSALVEALRDAQSQQWRFGVYTPAEQVEVVGHAAERVEPAGGQRTKGVDARVVCPECDNTAPAKGSSLRPGDICPECRRGYLVEREA
jgi:hypothetical protein